MTFSFCPSGKMYFWAFVESKHPPYSLKNFPARCTYYLTAAPVIVFCMSGRRAGKAKETLEALGYTKVLNAGGLNDLLNKLN